MKRKLYLLGFLCIFSIHHAQIGVKTKNPLGIFHVDGNSDNPSTGIPTALQQQNDFIITSSGLAGVGTIVPTEKMEVNGNVKINNSSSSYGSYLQAENIQGVKMTVQATSTSSPYGARGILGTTSSHPVQLVYNASPVVYMDNGTLAPNGTNLTYLGAHLNRWNGVYAGGGGFNAKNASGLYVGLEAESQNGVQAVFGHLQMDLISVHLHIWEPEPITKLPFCPITYL